MSHNIDLSSLNVRTDLALEEVNEDDKSKYVSEKKNGSINVITLDINEDNKDKFNKNIGKYITIEFDDVTDFNNGKEVEKVFIEEIKNMLLVHNIKKDDSCMIVGLGNEKSTPDSLGPKSVNDIIVTNHFFDMGLNVEEGFRVVSAFNPGVMGQTGMETSNVVYAIAKELKPDFIIVIDALKASNVNRVNKTIQITDAGINPGSGIGNTRKEISENILNIPVFAIGIPTVVDTVTIVTDTFSYLENYFYHMKNNIDKGNLSNNEKENLFGMLGTLSKEEFRSLIGEAINPIGYNMIVTPKEVDFVIDKLSKLVSSGINNALHEKVNHL